jgi:hypothetical protein
MTLYSGGDGSIDANATGDLEGRSPGHAPVMMPGTDDRGGAVCDFHGLLSPGNLGLWSLESDE